jgi:hypothetical protein
MHSAQLSTGTTKLLKDDIINWVAYVALDEEVIM